MKKALFTAVAAALTASACAQMPLPLADQTAPAPAQAPQLPASVERLTLIPFLGDLIAVMPRKATDNCPAIARFRLLTVDSGVQQSTIVADTKWEQDRLGAGQGDPGALGSVPAEVRESHAGRVPQGAREDAGGPGRGGVIRRPRARRPSGPPSPAGARRGGEGGDRSKTRSE